MKKQYISPEIEFYTVSQRNYIMGMSTEGRKVEGDPTSNGVPVDVGYTSNDNENPYAKGQGGSGAESGTNRSRENLWDSW